VPDRTARADWNRVYWDRFVQIRDRRRRDRAKGLIGWDDDRIDEYARCEAEKQLQHAINRWRESKGLSPPELREL
jgi:hypothetical protein